MDTPGSLQPERRLIDLELDGISRSFGEAAVLTDLSLTVYKGELCCLLGPSGCGKTTTLRIIDGLLEPDAGAVRLAGEDITRKTPQQRNLGMVFQNYALFPHLNVYENVAYGLRRRRLPETEIAARVNEVIGLVRLSGYQRRRVHQLSGGQQQRVALARSLVIAPRLLLLDEPLSNLDARLRADMRDEIRRIQRELGITTIYVTHDQEEAIGIADRIAVMNQGVIEQMGTPQQVYEKPASRFVADFIGRVNLLPGDVVDGGLVILGRRFSLPEGSWTDGTTVTAAIRPERITIADANADGIPATVRNVTYHGATARYHVSPETRPESELIIEVRSIQPEFTPGGRVSIGFRTEDMHIFSV